MHGNLETSSFLFFVLFDSFAVNTDRPLTEISAAGHVRSGHPGNLLEACKSGLSE